MGERLIYWYPAQYPVTHRVPAIVASSASDEMWRWAISEYRSLRRYGVSYDRARMCVVGAMAASVGAEE